MGPVLRQNPKQTLRHLSTATVHHTVRRPLYLTYLYILLTTPPSHYPFHLSLALVLEGQVLWTQISNVRARSIRLFAPASTILLSTTTSPSTKVAQLNTTFHSILTSIRYKDFFPVEEIEAAFNETYTAILERNTTALSSSLDSVITLIYNGLLADEGIQISDKTTQDIASSDTQSEPGDDTIGTLTSDAYTLLFGVSYIYYLVCAGMVLIMFGVFRCFNIRVGVF